jgi:ADP-ribose pyrophosphatase YjhB (NUDIX family)
VLRLAGEFASALASYTRIGWWGLVSPRVSERTPLVVTQGVIESDQGILLAIRHDLRGWELPGGTLEEGELPEEALRREVREETGLEVEVLRHVGDYVREGFRPHTARVYCCRPTGGALRTSDETRALRYAPPDDLPETLFPWYRQPIADALERRDEPVTRHEQQGPATILAALQIDLRMRISDDRAG